MSLAVQHASIAAWSDEAHVRENRARYREKFAAVVPMLEPVLRRAEAGRRLLSVGARARRRRRGVRARPVRRDARDRAAGQYLGARRARREPGRGYVRIALVPELDECVEAARRIVEFCR